MLKQLMAIGIQKLAHQAANKTSNTPSQGANEELVREVVAYLKFAEQEKTTRADITAKRDIALASIQANRDLMTLFMERTFQERAAVLRTQFAALDHAMARGNDAQVHAALNSLVSVVQSSPFRSIQEMQNALSQEGHVIRLE
jgi:hypothetical protein